MNYPTRRYLMKMDTRIRVSDVAHLFGKCNGTVYNWIKRKADFPARADDGTWSELEVLEYAAKYAIPTRRR